MRFKSTIFSQLIKEIPRYEFERIVKKHDGDYRVREHRCWDQLNGMLYCQLTNSDSLRSLVSSFNSHYQHFYHMGCRQLKRSTLSDANNKRSYKIYEEVFYKLLSKANKSLTKEIKDAVRLIDSTVIVLDKTNYGWAKGKNGKSGIKLHTVYDLNSSIPVHYEITNERINDITPAEALRIEQGVTYVFDKGYYKFEWWKTIEDEQGYFVTRLKKNSPTELLKDRKISIDKILSDQEVKLNKRISKTRQNPYDKPVRKIVVKRDKKKEPLVLITNDMTREAEEIAELYKKRWQIELFFKWVKQNLKIKKFLGRTENAVKIQIITALIAFLLIKILKISLPFNSSMRTIAKLINTNLMHRKSIFELFLKPPERSKARIDNQLELCYG